MLRRLLIGVGWLVLLSARVWAQPVLPPGASPGLPPVQVNASANVMPNGTASQPSQFFGSDPTTGFYRVGASQLGITLGGAAEFMFFQNGVNQRSDGIYSWSSTTDPTGASDAAIGRAAANQVSFLRGAAATLIPAKVFVASNFTTASTSLVAVTGLSWTMPANIQTNAHFDCFGSYQIATAVVAVDFGVQDVTIAPTNLQATGTQANTVGAAATVVSGAQIITTTTATSVTSATPAAITTNYPIELHGMIEQPSNAATSVVQIMVKTANAGDSVTVNRGMYCSVF